MSTRRGPVVLLIIAIVTFVVAVLGLVGSVLLNAFVFDKFDAYGEVPIPGSAVLQLPAGEVNVTFHTRTLGSSGAGIPIPPMELTIDPPDRSGHPRLVESFGGTTIINNTDVRQRVWVAHIPSEGAYRITVDGNVNGYIAPRLAFGHGSHLGWLPWAFGALLAVALIDVAVAIVWLVRRSAAARERGPDPGVQFETDWPATPAVDTDLPEPESGTADDPWGGSQPGHSYIPTDRGIRIEQLKDLAALRASGALTEAEYEAEKRRVLEGG